MKKTAAIILIFLLSLSCAFASVNTDNLNRGLPVIGDCLVAALVSEYSKLDITLPSTTVSIDVETRLPQRVAFFLADPADYVSTLNSAVNGSTSNILATIINLLKKTVSDPVLSAVYLGLEGKQYSNSDYILMGSVSFSYPEDATLKTIFGHAAKRTPSKEGIGLTVDLEILGNKLPDTLDISGTFSISINENKNIVIAPTGIYKINNVSLEGGQFIFQ